MSASVVWRPAKALLRPQLRIRLGQREDPAADHSRPVPRPPALAAGRGGAHGAGPRVDDRFERLALVAGVALHHRDDLGDQVVPALQLDVDVGPGVVGELTESGETIPGENPEGQNEGDGDQGNRHERRLVVGDGEQYRAKRKAQSAKYKVQSGGPALHFGLLHFALCASASALRSARQGRGDLGQPQKLGAIPFHVLAPRDSRASAIIPDQVHRPLCSESRRSIPTPATAVAQRRFSEGRPCSPSHRPGRGGCWRRLRVACSGS